MIEYLQLKETRPVLLAPDGPSFGGPYNVSPPTDGDDDDVYLDKLQTRGVKKSVLYM
jgi:hypothetical protein